MFDGDSPRHQQRTTTPHEHLQSGHDSYTAYEHEHEHERQHAFAATGAEDQQPLLDGPSDERRADVAPPSNGGGGNSNATRASAAGARILNAALPQFSQWLQDVNSHAQLQMHGLRRQGSSGGGSGGGGSASSPDAPSIATAENAATAAHHRVDARLLSDHDNANGQSHDAFTPQSRRRGTPLPRSVASLAPSSSASSSRQRGPLFEEDAGSDGNNATNMPFAYTGHAHREEEGNGDDPNNNSPRAQDSASSPATGRATNTTITAAATGQDNNEDQSAVDELQALFRRCHHSLPFVALFIIYFAYQHTTGIVVFFVGTVAIMGLDQRIRAQIALKEKASALHLFGIVAMCAIDMFALCCVDGDPNPLHHFAKTFHGDAMHEDGVFWGVLWTVVVNDFIIRLCSVSVKAVVAVIKSDSILLLWRRKSERGVIAPVTSPRSSGAGSSAAADSYMENDLESQSMSSSQPRAPSSTTFYRRKRKLYGIIEMMSIFARSLLAGVPWCSYYQLCSSKFIADTFTFGYILIKALILGTQGRKIVALVRSFVTLGLEFGVYVSHEDLVEAGSPDCSICYEEMHQPVKLSCSHMFCEECVMEWFDRERSCPLCRANMAATSDRGGEQDEVKPQFLDGSTSLFPQLF